MTRRQNGEHEIRIREWRQAFAAAGFEVERIFQFAPDVGLKLALKGVISRLQGPIRRRLLTFPLVRGYPTAGALGKLHRGALARRGVLGPKHTTGYVVGKH